MQVILEFLTIPVVHQLLQLDCVFYGMTLAQILSDSNVSCLETNVLKVMVMQKNANFVERALKTLNSVKIISNHILGQYTVVYEVPTNEFIIQLSINYTLNQTILIPSLTDVGQLYLDRSMLGVRADSGEPVPLFTLLQHCRDKICTICPGHFTNTKDIVQEVEKLYKLGWEITNSKIRKKIIPTADEHIDCPICKTTMNGKPCVETVCNHTFCGACWGKLWNHIRRSGGFDAATASTIVACPLCRYEMKNWECVPFC